MPYSVSDTPVDFNPFSKERKRKKYTVSDTPVDFDPFESDSRASVKAFVKPQVPDTNTLSRTSAPVANPTPPVEQEAKVPAPVDWKANKELFQPLSDEERTTISMLQSFTEQVENEQDLQARVAKLKAIDGHLESAPQRVKDRFSKWRADRQEQTIIDREKTATRGQGPFGLPAMRRLPEQTETRLGELDAQQAAASYTDFEKAILLGEGEGSADVFEFGGYATHKNQAVAAAFQSGNYALADSYLDRLDAMESAASETLPSGETLKGKNRSSEKRQETVEDRAAAMVAEQRGAEISNQNFLAGMEQAREEVQSRRDQQASEEQALQSQQDKDNAAAIQVERQIGKRQRQEMESEMAAAGDWKAERDAAPVADEEQAQQNAQPEEDALTNPNAPWNIQALIGHEMNLDTRGYKSEDIRREKATRRVTAMSGEERRALLMEIHGLTDSEGFALKNRDSEKFNTTESSDLPGGDADTADASPAPADPLENINETAQKPDGTKCRRWKPAMQFPAKHPLSKRLLACIRPERLFLQLKSHRGKP